MLEIADSSPVNYEADLQRKMGTLDYAMITAAKSNSATAWDRFMQLIELAKKEPSRVAGRAGFEKSANALAEYAAQLEIMAIQGRGFTEILKNNSLKNREYTAENYKLTVKSTSVDKITLVYLEKQKPATVDNPNPERPRPRTIQLDLRNRS